MNRAWDFVRSELARAVVVQCFAGSRRFFTQNDIRLELHAIDLIGHRTCEQCLLIKEPRFSKLSVDKMHFIPYFIFTISAEISNYEISSG